jgi:hypothetical protein
MLIDLRKSSSDSCKPLFVRSTNLFYAAHKSGHGLGRGLLIERPISQPKQAPCLDPECIPRDHRYAMFPDEPLGYFHRA